VQSGVFLDSVTLVDIVHDTTPNLPGRTIDQNGFVYT